MFRTLLISKVIVELNCKAPTLHTKYDEVGCMNIIKNMSVFAKMQTLKNSRWFIVRSHYFDPLDNVKRTVICANFQLRIKKHKKCVTDYFQNYEKRNKLKDASKGKTLSES